MGKNTKKSKPLKRGESGSEDEGSSDIVIPVMGPTGAGKSTFINAILKGEKATESGQPLMKVGLTLSSCTKELEVARVDSSSLSAIPHLRGRRLVLVDTPGFDDTYEGDAQILRRIAEWLKSSYNNKMVLAGVIYLHDISQDRFSGTARRNLEMFNHLCGAAALPKVVIGTTKSNKISPETVQKYETELKAVHWKTMIGKGTRVAEFRGDYRSARGVVNLILGRVAMDTVLEIQRELVFDKKITPETKAGQELRYTLQEILEMQKQMADVEARMAERDDPDAQQTLRDMQRKIEAISRQIRDLQVPFSHRVRRFFGF